MVYPPKIPVLTLAVLALLTSACSKHADIRNGDLDHLHLPDGFTVELVAGPDLLDYPMFATLDEEGRLFVFESTGNVYEKSQDAIDDPRFRIKLLVDEDGDGRYDRSTIFADKLSFPQGGVFHNGSLIASSAPDLLKLTDTDGDGVADRREVLLSGWTLNVNANSLIGPFLGPDGWLYLTSAIEGFDVTSREGERMKGETARIWRVRPDGSGLEWVSAGGMNNPVELAFTGAGEVIGTQTFFVEPQRGLRDAITYWTEGGVYGKENTNITRDGLPRTGDLMPVVTKYSRVAPSGIGVYRSDALGAAFKDNLFSTQFNTHAVIRHQLLRDSASFRTEDEPFFWSDNPDFHPTDVLEDGDGSLLVVETGGWFILGCPLSQVSKPQLKGGIYRIRRTEAPRIEDPYGNAINWESLPAGELAAFLEDPRPFVADRAGRALAARGQEAIAPLAGMLAQSLSEDARARAIFTLYQIATEEARAALRMGFRDESLQVRIAAARAAGLAKDPLAADLLMELVAGDEPAARRQAAMALGQIGETRAIPALLAAASTGDRFVRHAIIYSLITLNQPAGVVPGLRHPAPGVQEAALIALDQMQGSPLRAGQLTPFLNAETPSLRQTALWVASHHPEWSKEMIAFLERQLTAAEQEPEEQSLLGAILTSYCGDPHMQGFMAQRLQSGSRSEQLFIMKKMADCKADNFPESWIKPLGLELASSDDPAVKSLAIKLVRLRQIAPLKDPVRSVADNNNSPTGLRIEAIDALAAIDQTLSDHHFNFLLKTLLKEKEAPLLQRTASILAQAGLSEGQLRQLAAVYLPVADPFTVPSLLPAFRGAHNIEIGKALAARLMSLPSLDSYTEENLKTLFEKYPPELAPTVGKLLAKLRQAREERLQRLTAWEGKIEKGNIENGRALFFGKATCWTCHAMGDEGGDFGPDLTSIQHDRSAHDILEAVLYPGVSFVREYETYQITTKTGKHIGIIREQTPDAVVLATAPETSIRIPSDEITEISTLDSSLMPQGLDLLLTEQEFADLMAFLYGKDLVY